MTTFVVPRRRAPAASIHHARSLAAALAVMTLTACDFPTELPIFEPRLVVEAEKTTLTVGQLLPSSVTIQGSNFALSLSGASASRTLGDICGAPCAGIPSGTTVPVKPAFTATITASTNLPADVRTANLVSGNLRVAINNQFSFDPIRPGGATNGTAVITISNAGRTIGTRTLNGNTDALPPGQTTTIDIPMTAGALAGTGPVTASVELNSPVGGPTTIRQSDNFTITATPQNFLISTANVAVTNKNVNVTSVTLDLDDIDEDLIDRVKEGALILNITNPFGVTGTLTVSFGGVVPNKTITVSAGTSTQRIVFSGAELRQLLGKQVTMSISGPVSGPSAGVTVTPTQVLSISSLLDLTLTTKTDNN